jgi:hypothetical protein
MKKRITRFMLIILAISVLTLSGCGGATQKAPHNQQPNTVQAEQESVDETHAAGPYWQIEVSDTNNFSYAVPGGNGGAIDMTATLYFIAWKQGGEDVFGQYEGRAMVALDMDLSKAGTGGVSYSGGVLEDSISESITFEMLPFDQNAIKVEGEDVDLATLADFVGQAEIITDEHTISQQAWKALADGQVKLDVNSSFGDGEKEPQGFTLKAGEDTVLISVGDLATAYGLDAFSGMITSSDTQIDALAWFREKVMTRMEERLALSEQSASQQMPTADFDSSAGFESQNGFTVDSEGREGIDTNGDGRLEIYYGEDGEVCTDFDGDGKYDITESEYSDGFK